MTTPFAEYFTFDSVEIVAVGTYKFHNIVMMRDMSALCIDTDGDNSVSEHLHNLVAGDRFACMIDARTNDFFQFIEHGDNPTRVMLLGRCEDCNSPSYCGNPCEILLPEQPALVRSTRKPKQAPKRRLRSKR